MYVHGGIMPIILNYGELCNRPGNISVQPTYI